MTIVIFKFKNISRAGLDIPKGRLGKAELDSEIEINTVTPFDLINEMLMTCLNSKRSERLQACKGPNNYEILLKALNDLCL